MPYTRRSHTNGDLRPNGLCIHVITYGRKRGHAQIPIPKLIHVDCVQTEPPPLELREKYTGVDKELSDVYWSNPLHVKLLQETLDQLEIKILNGPFLQGGCAAVVVNCMSGKHRSVAMAEKLADEIQQWDRIVVNREHLDTDVVSGQTRETRIEVGTHNDRPGTQGSTQERVVSSPEVEEMGEE
ncbi:MAG: hypothetical protein ALECFALPRED_006708 [Alectoria fallacina]|uniref:RapZ C-terminal domain-containing protein n=1 Tax=Alectoria fallacina TaxID=1903189 RepID=A0A8H3G7C5_9LECA|nr:MAG: hypothetical protein ALECFALPRED_006708 [Alectoria fallacina]